MESYNAWGHLRRGYKSRHIASGSQKLAFRQKVHCGKYWEEYIDIHSKIPAFLKTSTKIERMIRTCFLPL